jgi:hypothetical protein
MLQCHPVPCIREARSPSVISTAKERSSRKFEADFSNQPDVLEWVAADKDGQKPATFRDSSERPAFFLQTRHFD